MSLQRFSYFLVFVSSLLVSTSLCHAAGGTLTLLSEDEKTGAPTITRVQIWRGGIEGKKIPIRRTVPAGLGVVLDQQVDLKLNDSVYGFRMVRGPEYRIISGTFTLEDTSLDKKTVRLPRMVNMLDNGWTSGDCAVVASANSVALRMASEDLHFAAVFGHVDAKPIANRDEPIDHSPTWIDESAKHHDGLAFYGQSDPNIDVDGLLPVQRIVAASKSNNEIRVAIENPFAWPLPVWLASQQIDGAFLLGDWLRLDRKVMKAKHGRAPEHPGFADGKMLGRWADEIYRMMIDAGLQIAPLAGGGDDSGLSPIGYNRLYVGHQPRSTGDTNPEPVTSAEDWWAAAWNGNSVATNGPMLRPLLAGKIPGHVFKAKTGDPLKLQPEIALSVRDKVEYLEVIRNGSVHYSARLDEFARAGGYIPPLEIDESSWIIIRVVTLHEDHYRAAISAPWYVEFDGQRRVSKKAVDFFQRWLGEYEQRLKLLPPDQLQKQVPFVRAARKFWAQKAAVAVE